MGLLKIKVTNKIFITFGWGALTFVRQTNTSKEVNISYSNGTGQQLSSRQTLYSVGTIGTEGYFKVTSTNTVTLNNSGVLSLTVDHYPTSTESNKTISFNYDNSQININLSYNSNPNTEDVIVQTNNRTDYTFLSSDFTTAYSDYDNDDISQIAIFGSVNGIKYNESQYMAGTFINITDIEKGLLKYTPLNQDAYYELDLTWKAKDSQGNISLN